jgi:hypothetical protein
MTPRRRGPGGAAIALGVTALVAAPAALAADVPGVPGGAPPTPAAVRSAALDAAAGWRDSLEAFRPPALPTPADTESAILLLSGPPPAASADPGARAAAAREVTTAQDALAPLLQSLGATVTFRYRVLLDAVAVRVPAGGLEALAALPEVTAVVPVTYLAPAGAGEGGSTTTARGRGRAVAGAPGRPAHIALVDGAIDPSHPWLGGGMGPTFPVIGGADLVDGDGDPRVDPADPGDAHGTQMASIVLRSAALAGLSPARTPRLLAYRVLAREPSGGRLRPLARSDRVLAALEAAVDPNGDGNTSDRAEVILMGLAESFDAGGVDPVRRALEAADRVGSTVVVPAGNDGPTFSRPGSVGGPASTPTAIVAGGLGSGRTPRTAELTALVGPAAAGLGPLPLMGPDPPGRPLPAVVLREDSGLASGDRDEDYVSADGTSRVDGALAVVARGGAGLREKAALAAAAGAAALAVWDGAGPPSFPGVPDDGTFPIPVVGLGSAQGEALARVAAEQPALRVTLSPRPQAAAPPGVAAFSSWGPTADGRQKPDLLAPAVDRPAAWPGRGPDGAPREGALTGTSAAAAEVAAQALRLRVDRPGLGPRAVQSVLVQSARPLEGVAVQRQGAGVLAPPGSPALRISPAIVTARPARSGAVAWVTLGDLAGRRGRYAADVILPGGGRAAAHARVTIPAGGTVRIRLTLPALGAARLVVLDAEGRVAATAPVVGARPASTPRRALGRPEVRADGALPEVAVQVGMLEREAGRVRSVRLHAVRIALVPEGGGIPLPVRGAKDASAWPAGTYRFLLARRLADGLVIEPGRYRVRVSARGPDGTRLVRNSPPFTIH